MSKGKLSLLDHSTFHACGENFGTTCRKLVEVAGGEDEAAQLSFLAPWFDIPMHGGIYGSMIRHPVTLRRRDRAFEATDIDRRLGLSLKVHAREASLSVPALRKKPRDDMAMEDRMVVAVASNAGILLLRMTDHRNPCFIHGELTGHELMDAISSMDRRMQEKWNFGLLS